MRVFLRNATAGLYYAGTNQWVAELLRALDLEDIEHATQVASDGGLAEAEVILSYDDPHCQLALPVRPEWPGRQAERVAA